MAIETIIPMDILQESQEFQSIVKEMNQQISNVYAYFDFGNWNYHEIYHQIPIYYVPIKERFRSIFCEYSLHEEHILDIQKIIGCSSQEADAYLQIYPYEPRNLTWYLRCSGDFPLIQNYIYSCCLNCHKRQWRYVGDWRGPCVYCGYYDPNIDPRFSIEVGESERFQPGEMDIEI